MAEETKKSAKTPVKKTKTPIKKAVKSSENSKATKQAQATSKERAISKSKSTAKAQGQRKRQRLRFGTGVYYFEYKDPKYWHRLHKFDATPLIYPLHVTKKHTLAINLHFINPVWRLKFIRMLTKASKKFKSSKRFAKFVYLTFRDNPKYRFAYPAIRRYLNNRIKFTKRINREELGYFTVLRTKYKPEWRKGGLA